MGRTVMLCCVLASIALGGFPGSAVEVEEIGIQLYVVNQPLLSDGHVQLGARVGAYAKLAVSEAWGLRVTIDNPLAAWLPRFELSSSHRVADRWIAEATFSATIGAEDWGQMSVSAGARYVALRSPSFRVMLSSFPISLTAIRYLGSWTVAPVLTPNLTADVSWAPSATWVLGQSIGLSVVSLPPSDEAPAIPLPRPFGLLVRSLTHAGVRP